LLNDPLLIDWPLTNSMDVIGLSWTAIYKFNKSISYLFYWN